MAVKTQRGFLGADDFEELLLSDTACEGGLDIVMTADKYMVQPYLPQILRCPRG
jgi:hypothetical protein